MSNRAIRIRFSGAMFDLKYGKRLYCFLKRGAASVKRQMRRRTRRATKAVDHE